MHICIICIHIHLCVYIHAHIIFAYLLNINTQIQVMSFILCIKIYGSFCHEIYHCHIKSKQWTHFLPYKIKAMNSFLFSVEKELSISSKIFIHKRKPVCIIEMVMQKMSWSVLWWSVLWFWYLKDKEDLICL